MAANDDALAQWAASFLAAQATEIQPSAPSALVSPTDGGSELCTDVFDGAITVNARALLRAVDAGGVPAFMTSALKQIALDNHIAFTEQSTPNEVIAALRARCMTAATTPTTNFE